MVGLKTTRFTGGKMAKILCIEDDYFISDMYSRSLKKAGHTVDVISNGQEALKAAKENVYDIILLDLMMPEKNGVEILEALRGSDRNGLPMTKIIVATNFDEPEKDRQHLEQMADGYIIKADVTPSKMLELIEQILQK